MRPYMQIESNATTGNWAYVVRDSHNQRLVATGDRDTAMQVLFDSTSSIDGLNANGTVNTRPLPSDERRQLLAEKTCLGRMIASLPRGSVIDRMSLEARKANVEAELAATED